MRIFSKFKKNLLESMVIKENNWHGWMVTINEYGELITHIKMYSARILKIQTDVITNN